MDFSIGFCDHNLNQTVLFQYLQPFQRTFQIHAFFTSVSISLQSHEFSTWKLHNNYLLNPLSAFGCLTAAGFWRNFSLFLFEFWSVGFQMVLLFSMSLSSVCLVSIRQLRKLLAKIKFRHLLLSLGTVWAWGVLYTFHYHVLIGKMCEKVIHQIDSKNEWLLLSADFTAKFGVFFFFFTLENDFS